MVYFLGLELEARGFRQLLTGLFFLYGGSTADGTISFCKSSSSLAAHTMYSLKWIFIQSTLWCVLAVFLYRLTACVRSCIDLMCDQFLVVLRHNINRIPAVPLHRLKHRIGCTSSRVTSCLFKQYVVVPRSSVELFLWEALTCLGVLSWWIVTGDHKASVLTEPRRCLHEGASVSFTVV